MTAKPPLQSGLTLIELLVAISVLAILLSIGIPSFQSMVAQNRATSAANELQSTLQFARSAAIAQARQVTVCAANFATSPPTCRADRIWSGGWIVLQQGQAQPLRERRALHPSISLTGHPQRIYSTTGTLLGQTDTQFDLTVASGPGASRRVCMSMSGSSRIVSGDVAC